MPTQGAGTNVGEGGRHDGQGDESQYRYTTSSQENHFARKLQIPSDLRGGWLLELAVKTWGRGSSINGKLCVWADDQEGGWKLIESPMQTWTTTEQWQRYFPPTNNTIRMESGKSYWVGMWSDVTKSRYHRLDYTGDNQDWGKLRLNQTAESFTGYKREEGIPCIDFFYQQNAAPSTGAWRSISPTGQIPTSQPVFEGTMPHNNGDGDFDYTQRVHLQVWIVATGEMLHDKTFDVTSAERGQGYWSRAPVTLPVGVQCAAKYNHHDSWGMQSLWSSTRTFTVLEGPQAPTITAPVGKLNVQTGYNITGTYRSNVGRNANAFRVRLLNESASQVIFDSGFEAMTLTPGQAYSIPAWHDALRWGTKYVYEVQFRDTANVIGPTTQQAFRTNAPPSVPSGLTPGDNRNTGERVLRAQFADPDGDTPTQAEIELYNVTAGAMVAGFPKVVSLTAGALAYDASADIVVNNNYRWRARGTDGLSTWELAGPEQRTIETSWDEPTSAQPAGHVSGYFPYNGAIISQSSTYARSGTRSLRVFTGPSSETKDVFADLGIMHLDPDVTYNWEGYVYSPFATYIPSHRLFLQEAGGARRSVAPAGAGVTALAAGTWTKIQGSGKTPSDWQTDSWVPMRPPRKADNTAYDSTNSLYYDDMRVWGGTVYGRYSLWQHFTARDAPTVTYIAPTLEGVRNRVPTPQPDFADSTFWTEISRVDLTVNMLTPNQASVETDTTGLGNYGAATVSRSTAFAWNGSASLQVVNPSGSSHGMVTMPGILPIVDLGISVVGSAYVRMPAGVPYVIEGRSYDPETGSYVGEGGGQQAYTGTGSFQRVQTLPWTNNLQDFIPGFQIRVTNATAQTFYVDGLMLEISDTVASTWELGSGGTGNYIDTVGDSDSAFGEVAWRGTASPNAVNYLRSEMMDVDATKPIITYLYVKKEPDTGTAQFWLEIACFDVSNNLISNINPGSIASTSGVDPATSYEARGGVIWPTGSGKSPSFPAGTAKIRFVIYPSWQNAAIVRFDAAFWDYFPNVAVGDAPSVQKWYGYIDGSIEDYNPLITGPTHDWEGVPGASLSTGLHVGRDTGLNLHISYSHPSGSAKASDHMSIYQATIDGWLPIHQSAAEGGNRTIIPLPTNLVQSENQYKVVTTITDSVGVSTQLPDLFFEVRYDGPRQLNINYAYADNDRAEVHLGFESSGLALGSFAGIEIAIGSDRTVVDRIMDYRATTYVWPYPISGVDEEYWIRQVEIRGAEEVEGRWDRVTVRSDYEDWWFKDVDDPRRLAIRFPVFARDEPQVEEAPEGQDFRPWGTRSRVHLIPEGRPQSGTVVMRILDTDSTRDDQVKMMEELRQRWRVMCFLSHRPDERRFVMVKGRNRTSAHLPYYAVYDLSWQEASYSLSWHEREGVYQYEL